MPAPRTSSPRACSRCGRPYRGARDEPDVDWLTRTSPTGRVIERTCPSCIDVDELPDSGGYEDRGI